VTDVVRRRSGRRTVGAKGKATAFASHLWIGISNNVSRGSGTIKVLRLFVDRFVTFQT